MPARRRFGSVRRLPSGRWQARYWDAAGNRVGAPTTSAMKGDAQRWLSAAVGPRWEALVFAATCTGLRWGELAGLRRCDVDLERNLVPVARKLAEVNGRLSFSPPKTAAGKRTIGMPSFVARSLAVHIDLYALPGADGLVFPSADGQPMRRSNFRRRVWEPATTEVGLSGFRFHDFRHTAATLAAASGTSLKALMARIGHASAAAALRYQHVIDARTPTS